MQLLKDILKQTEAEHGNADNEYATSLNNLAAIYRNSGRYDAAEPLLEEALSVHRRILGADHPAMATSLNNLAGLYDARGRYAEAEPLCTQALLINRRVLGGDHPNTASTLNNLQVCIMPADGMQRRNRYIKKRWRLWSGCWGWSI